MAPSGLYARLCHAFLVLFYLCVCVCVCVCACVCMDLADKGISLRNFVANSGFRFRHSTPTVGKRDINKRQRSVCC